MPLDEINIAKINKKIKEKIMLIGSHIKRFRNEKDITQQDLAFYIFSDKCLISRIENGSYRNVTLGTLIKIADVLDIEVQELFQD